MSNHAQSKSGKNLNFRNGFGRRIVAAAVVCLLWLGVTGSGFADIRIVSESEEGRTETLFKQNRIAAPAADGANMLLFCDTGEITLISSTDVRRYWRGTVDEMKAEFDGFLGEATGGQDGMPDLGSLLGGLFGAPAAGEIQVRVSKVGDETIAGYAAEHYRVETGSNNEWQTYEETWIAADLMKEVTAEVGACVDIMLEIVGQMPALATFGMDELEAVLTSPDYQALMAKGFPVRSQQTMRIFGMSVETFSEVVAVSRDAISEDAFTVPVGYQRVNSLFEMFGM